MTGIAVHHADHRAVRFWLLSIAALIALMVLVGGATRLTESGLSIVRVEAGDRHAAAAQRGAVAAGVRWLQDHSAISRAQRRHGSRPVQDDLLVGMEPSPARARDRRCLSAAVSLVCLARRARRRPQAAAVADLRSRRAAGRGRLVDGGVGTDRAGGSFAIPSRHPSRAGAVDLCQHRLDAAPACADSRRRRPRRG